MGKSRKVLKKVAIYVFVAFFLIIGLLTYFSSTIDRMLIPHVKIAIVSAGDILELTEDGEYTENRVTYNNLVPNSAIVESENGPIVYTVTRLDQDSDIYIVQETSASIIASDDLHSAVDGYYDYVAGVVYETTKSIKSGDRVLVEN